MVPEGVFDDLHAMRPQHSEKPRRIADRSHGMHCRARETLDRTYQRPVKTADIPGSEPESDRILLDGGQVAGIPVQSPVDHHLVDFAQPVDRLAQGPGGQGP